MAAFMLKLGPGQTAFVTFRGRYTKEKNISAVQLFHSANDIVITFVQARGRSF